MADNSNRLVLDTYTEQKEVSLKVVNREVFGCQSICIADGDLHFGNKVVVDYKDMCENYPALTMVGDCIPSLYVIRLAINKGKGIDYAEFVCGFDLLSDGHIWCGSLDSRDRYANAVSKSFEDMDDAVAHIDNILGVG